MTPYCLFGLGVLCVVGIYALCVRSERDRLRTREHAMWQLASREHARANRLESKLGEP